MQTQCRLRLEPYLTYVSCFVFVYCYTERGCRVDQYLMSGPAFRSACRSRRSTDPALVRRYLTTGVNLQVVVILFVF